MASVVPCGPHARSSARWNPTVSESTPDKPSHPPHSKGGRNLIILLAVVLAVLHQDVWFWGDRSLVAGFMPVGLAFHVGYSIVAALLWALAIKIAWPHHLEAFAEEAPLAVNQPTEGFTAEEAADSDGVGEL